MVEIKSPTDYLAEVRSLDCYLKVVSDWYSTRGIKEEQFLGGVWFRGHGKDYPLRPGVYRDGFMKRAKDFNHRDDEDKRRHLSE